MDPEQTPSSKQHPDSADDSREKLERKFLDSMRALGREDAEELLELARTSYRLRDDDNIYLGRIQYQKIRALREQGARRGAGNRQEPLDGSPEIARKETARNESAPSSDQTDTKTGFTLSMRQLIGTPANAGIVTGKARVISFAEDLFAFQKGEIIVCDSIDPNITFILPLCAGIVERRGGMLIHGAIIAREYDIPCVVGVKNAATLIPTGTRITVDGYLGIIVLLE
jgi:pyruvate,water dikinase